ncbi:hypothetical protein [Nocardiopsis sinuspersici]|uniref:Uncharacterized protein n=1 Tax=Nocardiopsis sinuspersici TaxID=501010 RepID=A0A1V3C3G0_9ACTN|nr:hypothetical protein [Nocardiopsis sinuspersici]OOC55331.1 hypothetical protein NOSIN_17155 [Nocardiopsis sinuspersici]
MKNETLERLRLPGAWTLLAAAGVLMLSGLIQVIVMSSAGDWGTRTPFASAMYGAGAGHFFGVGLAALVAAAAALVLTSDRARPSASPVVLTAMIITGVGLLFCLITVICGFIGAVNIGHGFARMLETVAQGAVFGLVGFAVLKAYNDPALVPRAMPQQSAYPQQFPPPTGAQQSFAQPGYPVQDAAQQQAAAAQQQAYGQQYGADAAQQQYGTGAQQAYGQYGADASGQQAAYGQQYGADASGQQQAYGQYGADAAAQQQAAYGQQYGTDASAQQAAAAQQQAYGQQYGADAAQQQYGTGAQQAYGQYGADASGQQAAYGQQYGTDASGQQAAYGQQYGTDAAAQQQAYGQYGAAAPQYGTGAQQAYGQYGADASGQQAAYGQQGEYAYDPSQYAPQGTDQQAPSVEQAAQDAIQYGWYQGADQGQQAQESPPEGGLDPFFNSGENNGSETPGQGGGSYGGQYGSGAGYGSDQQGQGGTGDQQGWYGGDDKR